ncbi:lysophospholipase L1-like esterase [Sphingomonas vulcanisoli]|uniref:Lysophospholipase L1-like esterase n=1 Tax=Sphingomonas vulcanisoli TaxID=1658060 RepID=A0ABX0TQ97_9SPHN|nr:SGNH/GDSL hydrolase family protein [Sphingomonas vulcanisoli]NIJ06929.1 lysophospholipase L1-like esterase [Sphingomonas vulcanisoli]
MIVLAALAMAAACPQGLCNATALRPYLAKLAAARGRDGRPVHILQIGDSHTAGDAISGAWRDLLQTRYGSGGRGVLPPGRPYDGYITHGVTVTASSGWDVAADFGRASADPKPLGLSAYSLTAYAPGATMALDAEPQERFDRVVVCALSRPGAGSIVIRAGEKIERVALNSPTDRPECETVKLGAPAQHVDLATEDGPVTITSWATFLDNGGVALSNLGVVGSQLIHFSRTDDMVLAEELRAYQPDLIVIAFGTNEGFSPRFAGFDYEILLRSQIARMRRLAGNVPILLLGAPDALSRRPDLKANGAGDASACSDNLPPLTPPPAPVATEGTGFAATMAKIGQFLGVTATGEASNAGPATTGPSSATSYAPMPSNAPPPGKLALFPPPALDAVREVQARVATSLHTGFWDWQYRMGGRCTALRWVRAAPPLMRGDYVHYTSAGGREIAQRLQADLDAAAAK